MALSLNQVFSTIFWFCKNVGDRGIIINYKSVNVKVTWPSDLWSVVVRDLLYF